MKGQAKGKRCERYEKKRACVRFNEIFIFVDRKIEM